MKKKSLQIIAREISKNLKIFHYQQIEVVANALAKTNPRFNKERFFHYCIYGSE